MVRPHEIIARSSHIEVDGHLLPTSNSAGHPIHASEVGIRNFWRWFGRSAVKDQAGLPVTVFHGTAGAFNSFDHRHSGRNYPSTGGRTGFFFTSSPATASVYAEKPARAYLDPSNPEAARFGDGTAHIMPVYINIHSPLVIRTQQYPDKYFDYQRQKIYHRAQQRGADGIIVHGQGRDLYVAFDPVQIKSALGNSGAFHPASSCLCDHQPPVLTAGLRDRLQSMDSKLTTLPAQAGPSL